MYEGELVALREYRKEDTERALSFINHPEVSRLMNTAAPFPYTLWDEEKFVESQSARRDTYTFAIETLADRRYIGGCGINRLDWKNRNASVGIMIGDPAYWGKGYGTDAMRVLLAFLFCQLGLHRVELDVFSFNPRAQRSYQKAGFVQEGRKRQALYRDGQFHDVIGMAILRDDYDALYGKKD